MSTSEIICVITVTGTSSRRYTRFPLEKLQTTSWKGIILDIWKCRSQGFLVMGNWTCFSPSFCMSLLAYGMLITMEASSDKCYHPLMKTNEYWLCEFNEKLVFLRFSTVRWKLILLFINYLNSLWFVVVRSYSNGKQCFAFLIIKITLVTSFNFLEVPVMFLPLNIQSFYFMG